MVFRSATTRPHRAAPGPTALALLLALAAGPSAAHEPHHHGAHHAHAHGGGAATEAVESEAKQTQVTLLDLPLLDADGRSRKFRSEVVGDGIVAMDFVYTSCTTVCPVLSAIFAQVYDRLGDRREHGVSLLSLSVDPATDVPARLKRYAAKFGAGPGWTFLTGEKASMDRVLTGLGAYTPDVEEHAPMILVGDARRGVWRRLYGFVSPEQIVEAIDELIAARRSPPSS